VTGQVDGLVMTNLDRMDAIPVWRVCDAYRYAGREANLKGFFEQEGELISSILVSDNPTDLDRQERLTRMLIDMQPVYSLYECGRESYPDWVSQKLGLSLALISSGPTAMEKEVMGVLPARLREILSRRAHAANSLVESSNGSIRSRNEPTHGAGGAAGGAHAPADAG